MAVTWVAIERSVAIATTFSDYEEERYKTNAWQCPNKIFCLVKMVDVGYKLMMS